ncbi:hypothetical protein LX36DRAFT_55610 [Colletotrichum falcatum]|nr:hypothetical protein LX36DRAFT_55610 [Colletotrichum falcatum]
MLCWAGWLAGLCRFCTVCNSTWPQTDSFSDPRPYPITVLVPFRSPRPAGTLRPPPRAPPRLTAKPYISLSLSLYLSVSLSLTPSVMSSALHDASLALFATGLGGRPAASSILECNDRGSGVSIAAALACEAKGNPNSHKTRLSVSSASLSVRQLACPPASLPGHLARLVQDPRCRINLVARRCLPRPFSLPRQTRICQVPGA